MTVTRSRLTTKAATVEKALRMSVQGVRKVSKYRNQPTMIDGIRFASKAEGRRYQELRILELLGKIRNLGLQPGWKFSFEGRPVLIRSAGFPNGRQAGFKADFRYWDVATGKEVIEDVKSPASRTQAYVLRKAMLECMLPGVRVVEV